jgi:hypothetical protein
MGVWHTRVNFEIPVVLWILPDVIAQVSYAVVGGTHKCVNSQCYGLVDYFDDCSIFLEPDGLRPRFLVRSMVYRKKLVIAK